MGMVASNQSSKQRWEDNNSVSPENFITEIEILVQDIKFYGINMTDYELITRLIEMLPKTEIWTSFSRHVPPHKSTREHARETFLEWASNAAIQTSTWGTAYAFTLQQADRGGRFPFTENADLLEIFTQAAEKFNCKVCLKCRRVGDHLTQHHNSVVNPGIINFSNWFLIHKWQKVGDNGIDDWVRDMMVLLYLSSRIFVFIFLIRLNWSF